MPDSGYIFTSYLPGVLFPLERPLVSLWTGCFGISVFQLLNLSETRIGDMMSLASFQNTTSETILMNCKTKPGNCF